MPGLKFFPVIVLQTSECENVVAHCIAQTFPTTGYDLRCEIPLMNHVIMISYLLLWKYVLCFSAKKFFDRTFFFLHGRILGESKKICLEHLRHKESDKEWVKSYVALLGHSSQHVNRFYNCWQESSTAKISPFTICFFSETWFQKTDLIFPNSWEPWTQAYSLRLKTHQADFWVPCATEKGNSDRNTKMMTLITESKKAELAVHSGFNWMVRLWRETVPQNFWTSWQHSDQTKNWKNILHQFWLVLVKTTSFSASVFVFFSQHQSIFSPADFPLQPLLSRCQTTKCREMNLHRQLLRFSSANWHFWVTLPTSTTWIRICFCQGTKVMQGLQLQKERDRISAYNVD